MEWACLLDDIPGREWAYQNKSTEYLDIGDA